MNSGRFGGDDDSDEVDGRVERVFTDAVDRQVAEQRALNELLETTADRLDAIEAGLNNLRETSSTRDGALRSEMQEGITRLAEEVQTRFARLAGELERVREQAESERLDAESLTAVVRDAVADQLGGIRAQVLGRVASLEDRLDEQSRAIGSLREAMTDDRAAVERTVEAAAEDLLTDATERLDAAPALDRLREEITAIQRDELAGVVEHVQRATSTFAAEVDELQAIATAVSQAASRGDERMEALRTQLPDRVDSAVRGNLDDLRVAVHAVLDRRLGEVDDRLTASEQHFDDLRSTVERRFDQHLDATTARMDERMAAATERLDAVASRMEERLEATTEQLDEQVARATEQIDTRLEGAVTSIDQRLGAAEREFSSLRESVDEDLQDRLAASEQQFSALREEFFTEIVERFEASRQTLRSLVTDIDDRLEVSEQRFGSARAEVADRLTAVTDMATAARDDMRERLDDTERELAQLVEQIGEHVDANVSRMERLETTIDERLDDNARQTSQHLTELRDGVEERLSGAETRFASLRDDLGEHLSTSERRLASLRDDVDRRLAASEERFTSLRDDLDARQAQTMEELLHLVDQRLDAVADLTSQRIERATDELGDAERSLHSVGDDLSQLRDEMDARIDDGIRRAVATARREATGSLQELHILAVHVGDVLSRVEALKSSLVAYLQRRDQRLEEQRSEIFAELLDEFAGELSGRQRGRIARTLESARERVIERLGGGVEERSDTGPEVDDGASRGQAGNGGQGHATEAGSDHARNRRRPSPGDGAGLLSELLGEEETASLDRPPLGEDYERELRDEVPLARYASTAGDGDQTTATAGSETTPEDDSHVCPECGFVAKTGGGLASHRRSH